MLRRLVSLLIAALPMLLPGHVALAYPGADAGPRPWTPPRGKPAPLAGLKLLPPGHVLELLRQAGVPSSQFGFYARRVDAPRAFAALNEEQPFVLASTAKVVTTLAALDLLGPEHQWTTQVVAQGPIVDGRLDGDLLIVGGGDATLSSEALRGWFEQLHAQGLREIGGNIVLDRLAFALGADELARTPLPEPERPHHAWPDALPLDEGVLRVEVTPQPKGPAVLRMQPVLAGVQLVPAVAQGPGCSARAELAAPGAGALTLKVSGTLASDCGVQQVALLPLSHAEFSARAIAALWQDSGGTLRGKVVERSAPVAADADAPPAEPYAVHRSEKLPAVVREINKRSDNLLARNLWLTLAPGFPQRSATIAAARERVQQWLLGQGLKPDDFELDTGSGLSRGERARPRAMVQLLARAWASRQARDFVDSLPIAGVDGTLARRFAAGAATGRAFLKTGSLLDARALAGYVKARSGKVYAVAVMVNHPDAAAATPALDALIEWLADAG